VGRDPEGVKKDLFGLQRLTRGALAEMRTLLVELRPQALINADLGDLIRQLADGLAGRTEVEVILDIQGQHPLPAEVQTAFFRIAQESLNNVVKHARAGHVWIDYHNQVDDVSLCIRDNGCGFDMSNLPAERLGLKILHERAASIGANMRIESRPGCGTTVKVDWQGQQG